MRHRYLSSVAAIAFSVAMAGTALAQSAVATATADLNVRSGPGPEYEVIGVIPVDGEVGLEGCIENSKWCQVDANGVRGWAYSDYLIAEFSGRDVVVTESRVDMGVPVTRYEGPPPAGIVGAAGGAVAGALVGGPIGAAVGGIAGAAAMGTAQAALEPPPATVTTYVRENRVDPVYLEGEVVVGAGVPDTVTVHEIPDYRYRYVYVNGQPVLVNPDDRRIVYVIRD